MKKLTFILLLVGLSFVGYGQNIRGNSLWSRTTIASDTTYTPTGTEPTGTAYYDKENRTISVALGNGVVMQFNQESMIQVHNGSGATIMNGRVLGAIGGANDRVSVEYADKSKRYDNLIMSTEVIPADSSGLAVEIAGRVNGVNTGGFPVGKIYLDTLGLITSEEGIFPDYNYPIGAIVKTGVTDGIIQFRSDGANFRNDIRSAFDGAIRETFDFRTFSDGTNVYGVLSNPTGANSLTLMFSDGWHDFLVPDTIQLSVGSATIPQESFIYIPMNTKELTSSTSYFTSDEHAKVAKITLLDAVNTQNYGALRNQNINNHLKYDNNNGHIEHISDRLRTLNSAWESGVATTISGTPANLYLATTEGKAWQLHLLDFPAQNMATGDDIHIVNDFTTPYRTTTNLNTVTAYSDGSTWNNEWANLVFWGVVNKTGEISHIMCNLSSAGYLTEEKAYDDAGSYTNYTIPRAFRGVGFLISRITVRRSPAGYEYNPSTGFLDLRGFYPNNIAGGGTGGAGGVTTFDQLEDTPSTKVGSGGYFVKVAEAENELEYIEPISIPLTDFDSTNFRLDTSQVNGLDIFRNDIATNQQAIIDSSASLHGQIDLLESSSHPAVTLTTDDATVLGLNGQDLTANFGNIDLDYVLANGGLGVQNYIPYWTTTGLSSTSPIQIKNNGETHFNTLEGNARVDISGNAGELVAPAISGTDGDGILRIGYKDHNWSGNELNIGIYNASTYGYPSWFQSAQPTDHSVNRPLWINPNGGIVAINAMPTNLNHSLYVGGSGLFTGSVTIPSDAYNALWNGKQEAAPKDAIYDKIASLTKSDIGLGNVENTALSTWTGSTNLTTLGTITTGTWNGSVIGDSYITKTGNWTGTLDGQDGSYYLNYNNLTNKPTIPTVNNSTITLQRNGSNIGNFTLNQSFNETFNFVDNNTQLSDGDISAFGYIKDGNTNWDNTYSFITNADETDQVYAADSNYLKSHVRDETIHFTQGEISIPANQITDFDTEVTNNSAVLANTGKDTTGIYHANRELLDAIDVSDTTRWGTNYNTDNQQLSIDSTGRVFTINLEDGGSIKFEDTNTTYDLSGYQQDTDTALFDATKYDLQVGLATKEPANANIQEHILNDADLSVTNELQTISRIGTDVALSYGGGSVSIADNDNDSLNEIQDISTTGAAGNISISSGSTLTLNVNDADNVIGNEYQDLSNTKVGENVTVEITNGTNATFSVADNDNSSTNELQTISKVGSTVTLSDGGGSFTDENTQLSQAQVNAYEIDPNVPTYTKSLTSASKLLTEIRTVDGSGSGLDADLFNSLALDRFVYGTNSTAFTKLANGSDINTMYRAGFYTVYNGINAPESGDFGFLNVPNWSASSSSARYNFQIGSRLGQSRYYIRSTDINGAGTWYQIFHSGNSNNSTSTWTANKLQLNDANTYINEDVSGNMTFTDVNEGTYTLGDLAEGYNNQITSASVTPTTTKTITLNQQDGGTVTASFTDLQGATGTGVSGRVAYWNSTTNITSDADFTFDGLNLRVGSTNGTGNVNSGNFTLTSDKRLKRNIEAIDDLSIYDDIEFVQFKMKADGKYQRYGVIAQDLEKINPNLVRKDKDGYYSVAYIDLLIAKTARQDEQIKELNEKVEKLTKLVEELLNEK